MDLKLMLVAASLLYFGSLAAESVFAARHRAVLKHVVHVNGTRGKSSVTRLIDAGLRAGGWRVFTKTTGTRAMMLEVGGAETPVKRRGKANISEQLKILSRAAQQNAEVLVIECMAVAPELQWVSQNKMLKADVGVITNVRHDHLDEMGETLPQICQSLCRMVPKNGRLFTAEKTLFGQIQAEAKAHGCKAVLTEPQQADYGIDFAENVALALEVCAFLGVEQEAALEGMKNYRPDVGALAIYRLPSGATAINALAANDPDSTKMIFERAGLLGEKTVLLINNRPDRGYRTQQMAQLAKELCPSEIWLMGANQRFLKNQLEKCTENKVRCFKAAAALPFGEIDGEKTLFAIGNIAGQGNLLLQRLESEATACV